MTAWTAIVIPIFIIGKCALDIVGMEYGSKYQCLTDYQFNSITISVLLFSFFIDLRNSFKSKN